MTVEIEFFEDPSHGLQVHRRDQLIVALLDEERFGTPGGSVKSRVLLKLENRALATVRVKFGALVFPPARGPFEKDDRFEESDTWRPETDIKVVYDPRRPMPPFSRILKNQVRPSVPDGSVEFGLEVVLWSDESKLTSSKVQYGFGEIRVG